MNLALDTPEAAAKATRIAALAAGASALLTLVMIGLATRQGGPFAGYLDAWSLLDVALLAGLGVGVYRKSRVSAVLLLVYYLVSQVTMRIQLNNTSGLAVAALFVLLYVQGVRGAFAYHRLTGEAGPGPADDRTGDEPD